MGLQWLCFFCAVRNLTSGEPKDGYRAKASRNYEVLIEPALPLLQEADRQCPRPNTRGWTQIMEAMGDIDSEITKHILGTFVPHGGV